MTTTLPANHPLRRELDDELHARPSESLPVPLCVSYLAMYSDEDCRASEWEHVIALGRVHGVHIPPQPRAHFSADLGRFRLKFERHTEFARYVFIARPETAAPFAENALARVPAEWVAVIPGRLLVSTHAALVHGDDSRPDWEELSRRWFEGNPLLGADIAGGAATAITDFRVRADGFSRLLVLNRGMSTRQAGRMLQRLFEIDSYRILALLALPVARELGPFLTSSERELTEMTDLLNGATEADEPALFDRLTKLEAAIESRIAVNAYRFSAAAAYYELVQRRIADLREVRIQGLPTFQEFTERRLAPAMATCRNATVRQESLSRRLARANQLLSTRVAITRERQNQALLESMNRRAAAQLRLQQTVEGLSIAAITYYIVGLVGYAAKGFEAAGVGVDPAIAVAVSIPVVAVALFFGVRGLRRRLVRHVDVVSPSRTRGKADS